MAAWARCDSFTGLRIAADEVEGPPSQKACDRVQIRGVDIAAEARRLERYRAATTESVAHCRPVPESHGPKLLDQLREAPGAGPEVGVDIVPQRPEKGPRLALFRTFGDVELLKVGQGRQGRSEQPRLVIRVDPSPPAELLRRDGLVDDGGLVLCGKLVQLIVGSSCDAEIGPYMGQVQGTRLDRSPRDLAGRERWLPADESIVIDRHELLEDCEVLLGIVGRGQERTEDAGLDEDQRLSPLPVGAKRRQGLAVDCLPLLLGLRRDFLGR